MPPVYALSFLWRRADGHAWRPVDTVSLEHPIDYIARARRNSEPGHEFCLLFFREIPYEVYRRHRPDRV